MNEPTQLIVGSSPDSIAQQRPLPPFSDEARFFLHDLSGLLLNEPECRQHPNLVALGFWLRPASLQKLLDDCFVAPPGHHRYPAGLVFHLAPANVDNLFVYPWAISLLCGNTNVIRLSSRESGERQLLLTSLAQLLCEPRHDDIRKRTAIVTYGHDDATTIALSSLAARRILWGGNETIAHLRSLPAPPLCQDVVFPDRRSAALLSSSAVLQAESLDTLLEDFYRDTYIYNQMACSSPRLVLWLKDADPAAAQERFWTAFTRLVIKKNPGIDPAALMDKQVAVQSMAITGELNVRAVPDARVQVVDLACPNGTVEDCHPGGGLFINGTVEDLNAMHTWLPGKHQTLTYWGIDASRLAQQSAVPLADRTVPVGQALNFNPVWDGMNLLDRLTRLVKQT